MKLHIILDYSTEFQLSLDALLNQSGPQTNTIQTQKFSDVAELLKKNQAETIFTSLNYLNKNNKSKLKNLKENDQVPVILLVNQNETSYDTETLFGYVDGIILLPVDSVSFSHQVLSIKNSKRIHYQTKTDLQSELAELRDKISQLSSNNLNLARSEMNNIDYQHNNQNTAVSEPTGLTENKLQTFIEKASEGILVLNEKGIIIGMNPCLEEISGYSKDLCLGMPVWEFQLMLSPLYRSELTDNMLKEYILQILSDRDSEIFGQISEKQIKRKDGSFRFVETNIYPIHNNGNFFVVSIIRDITHRKLFEEAVKNSESKYHGIFHANKDGISIFFIRSDNSFSQFVEANEAAYEMLGYTQAEFLSITINKLVQNTSATVLKNSIRQCSKNNHISIQSDFFHKDGSVRNVDLTLVAIEYSHQQAIMLIARDCTERKKTETDLQKSELLYRNLVERLPDGIYKSTHDGKFIEVNPAMVKMLGYDSREELIAIDIKKDLYFTPEDRESITLQEKNEEMGIFRLKKKDGTELWVEDHGWYTLDQNDEILFHEGILRDISERRLAELLLKESEERFKLLFEKAPVGYQSLDENGIITEINETWIETLGYSKEEAIGRNFSDLLTPEAQIRFKDKFSLFKETGELQTEFEIFRNDGDPIIVKFDGRIGHTNSGLFLQAHCALTDVTEKLKTEKIIAEEKILLRTLIDNIADPIYVKDAQGRKLISNKADLDIIGLTNESDAIGKTDSDLDYPGNAEQTLQDDLYVIRTGKAISNKLESFTDLNGNKRHFLTSKRPLRNDSGEIIGLVGVGHDITRQKQTDQKIIQLSKGIEQSPASIIITDTLGNIEYANQKTFEKTGYSLQEIKGKNPRIFQSGYTSKKEYRKLWQTIISGNEYRGELRNRKKNGEMYWESVLVFPIRDENGNIINYMAIKEDISDRENADLEIRKLSVAIEQNPASVIITDTKGRIEYVNKKFKSVIGYTDEELLGKIVRILKPGHTSEEEYIEIWNSLLAGNEWRGEQLNRTKNNEHYWESVLISPIKNQEGKITNYIIVSENISERKKMESDLIKAKEKAEESDRLKSAFLANMSHEIRTPLNSILGFSDLLTDPKLDQPSRNEFADMINLSGSNLLTIINDVLDLSKIEAGQISLITTEFSGVSVIREIQKEYSVRASSKGIELRLAEKNCDASVKISSDEMRIKQILINFVGNAIKFTNQGYVEIGVNQSTDSITFHVKDTGIGIDPAYHEKIFERFRQVESAQTRKYGGNGLGLAITKNLAELMGGSVRLESKPGAGSTFYLSFPDTIRVS